MGVLVDGGGPLMRILVFHFVWSVQRLKDRSSATRGLRSDATDGDQSLTFRPLARSLKDTEAIKRTILSE